MCKYIKAKQGYKFVLTELGFEQAVVRCKFENFAVHKNKYEKSVPISWLEKGYVKEVQKQ